MKEKTIFVTGFPGWLGTRFVDIVSKSKQDFQHAEYKIRCLINVNIPKETLPVISGIETVFADITKKNTLSGCMDGCDYVVHAAGIIHPKKVNCFYKINTEGTRNLIDESIRARIKRFIFISSNSPYGCNRSRNDYFNENSVITPYMHYGKSKYKAEQIVKNAQTSLETVILNACWYYGIDQPYRQTKFIKMIKRRTPILFGNGENKRSMCYIDNLVQAIILSIEKDIAKNKSYWIADETAYTMLEIYNTIAKILDIKNLKPLKIPAISSNFFEILDWIMQLFGFYNQNIHVAGEMAKTIVCNIDKAKNELGYCPRVSLYEGMKNSIAWAKDNNYL